MVKRLRKVGNSSALILDRALMELVGIEEDGEVQVTVREGALVLTPVNPRPVDPAQFEKLLARTVARRRSVLKRLAE